MNSPDEEAIGNAARQRAPSLGNRAFRLGLLLLIFTGFVVIVAMLPDFEKIHQPSKRTLSADNLHQIGLAMHNYVFDHKVFPPAVVYGEDGNPLYSWRVLLLPYIEQEHLYSQFKLDEPWDSPNNMPLLAQMPIVYMSPTQHKPKEPYTTHYQVFTAGGAIFEAGPQARQLSLPQIS